MTRQGYLIVHEKRARAQVLYLSLEDGFLRSYRSAQCLQCVNELRLSGCKLAVKAQKRADGVPHSFYLETRQVFVKDRSYTLGPAVRMELSAASGDDRQEWGKALFSWQRYYWRDPTVPEDDVVLAGSSDACRLQLEQLLARHAADKPGATRPGSSLVFASAAKQPLSFLRRNAHSLRRSLSLSLSMTSTASTVSSSTTSKPESAAGTTDCVKDKVVLAGVAAKTAAPVTPHFLSARGNNQEVH